MGESEWARIYSDLYIINRNISYILFARTLFIGDQWDTKFKTLFKVAGFAVGGERKKKPKTPPPYIFTCKLYKHNLESMRQKKYTTPQCHLFKITFQSTATLLVTYLKWENCFSQFPCKQMATSYTTLSKNSLRWFVWLYSFLSKQKVYSFSLNQLFLIPHL